MYLHKTQPKLQSLGRSILDTFNRLAKGTWNSNEDGDLLSERRVNAENERFRLWASSLGLYATGHASLDYRIRDAQVVRDSLADLMTELKEHLENCE